MIGLWREIIDCVKRDLHELATTSILLSSQLASESDTPFLPSAPAVDHKTESAQDKQIDERRAMQ